MRILIYGAGAIGQWLAAELWQAGLRPALIAREHHCRAIRAQGLRVRGRPGAATPECHTSLQELGTAAFDWTVLTVKAFQVADAVRDLQQSQLKVHGILTFQNGLGTDELVTDGFPGAAVAVGTTTRAVSSPEPGLLEPAPRGGIGLAPYTAGTQVDELAGRLRAAGQKVITLEDPVALKWSKLLLNMVCNASCAILDLTPAQLLADPRLYGLELRALREALQVMRALGVVAVDLPDYPVKLFARMVRLLPGPVSWRLLGRQIARGRGDKPPSLLIDIRSGRSGSEVSYLNGGVATAGDRVGAPAPVNRALCDILSQLVGEARLLQDYRGKPEKLLQEVSRRT